MSRCSGPWWRLGRHKWAHSTDEEVRTLMRANQDATSRFFSGSFEAREYRTCQHCGRQEQRDVYGGGYIPCPWTLRAYLPLAQAALTNPPRSE